MLRTIVALLIAALLPSAAHSEKRIALLIGNQSYTSEIGKLANPHNDIALLEKALKGLQFEVTSVRDASLGGMHQAVNAYARRVRAAGPGTVAFFYYAGHGAADAGTNYLIPVDVKSAEEGDLWDVSLRLTEITRKLKAEAGNATHFVVFDACRNNLKLRQAGSRALVQSRGFVPVAQESGMLVAYATAEGELASDVGAGAGPYSSVLAEEIVKPGVEAVTMFRNVQRRVRAAIKQEPYLGFNALGDVYLAGLASDPPKVAATPPPPSVRQSEAAEAWAVVKDTSSVATLEAFIRRFGDTFYGDVAKERLAELQRAEAARQADAARKKAVEDARAKGEAERVCANVAAVSNVQVLTAMAGDHKGTAAGACIAARIDALKAQQVAVATPAPPPEPPPGPSPARPLTAAEERAPKTGASFKECDQCPEMVVVPAGSFMMGSKPAEIAALTKQYKGLFDGFFREGPQRKVTISRPFAAGKFEVTFAEWEACAAGGGCLANPKPGQLYGEGSRHPVNQVSWDDAKEYVAWLSRKTGKMYRLLSEAEWEYAARAGTTTAYSWGNSIGHNQANCKGCGGKWNGPAPVGSFTANAFGLHDMHGNVREWVEDCWHETYRGAPTDGSAWTKSCENYGTGIKSSVNRGGNWREDPSFLRSADRNAEMNEGRLAGPGFRVARTLE